MHGIILYLQNKLIKIAVEFGNLFKIFISKKYLVLSVFRQRYTENSIKVLKVQNDIWKNKKDFEVSQSLLINVLIK